MARDDTMMELNHPPTGASPDQVWDDKQSMHIGIDARMYGTKNGGIGRYVEQLIKGLAETDHTNHYTIFVKTDTELPKLPDTFVVVHTDIHWYTIEEQWKLQKLFANHPVDLMHFPHWNVPILYRKPFIVTIHDLILLHYPSRDASTLSAFMYEVKHYAYKKVLQHAIRDAKHILTVSDFSKNDIIETFDTDPHRITVTHLGLPDHTPIPPYTQEKPYFLYVGVQYPHKNLVFLFELFERWNAQRNYAFDLILAGPEGPFTETIKTTITELNTKSNREMITFIPHPSELSLAALYRGATAFLFPSLYEGFGLPPLEAMATGIPVIAHSVASMPEILGDAALLIPQNDTLAWYEALTSVVEDENIRASLIKKGIERAAQFDWHKTISSTHALYNKISLNML